MSFLTFQIASLFYILLLSIVYFSQKRVKNNDNRIFSMLIILNLIGVVSDIASTALAIYDYNNPLLNPVSKLYLMYMVSWLLLFTVYVILISSERIKRILKSNIFNIATIVCVLVILGIMYLPLYNHSTDGQIYTYGPAVTLTYGVAGLCGIIWLYSIIKNRKNLRNKKYIPLLSFAVVGILAGAIQLYIPEVLIITFVLVFVNFLMYFTLENPDIEMLHEFKVAKDRAEKANEEKELFLYNVTQDLRTPLGNIRKACDYITTNTKDEDIKDGAYYISNNTTNMFNTINNVLDVTNMEINNIKVYTAKYNTTLVLKELYKIYSTKVPKGIKMRFNIDSNIPEMLYGDALRLKQLLTILLDNAFKYTDKGFVELNLNTIVKNDVCRLIIKVEDSGIGIKASELDEIFNKDNQMYANLEKVDDNKKNLAIAKSIATLLGGMLLLESEIGSGTKITVVLDQKIYNEKNDKLEELENDTSKYVNKTKVMVVSEDNTYLNGLVKKISKHDVEIEALDLGAKCLEKIRSNNKYDLIIIDEELTKLSALDILNKLKDVRGFNIDVAILTENPENKGYIKDGFKYVLNRKVTQKEIDEVLSEIE